MKAKSRLPMWSYILVAFVGLVLLTIGSVGHAQGFPPCSSFGAAQEALATKYNEHPVAAGLVNEGAAVVLFAAPGGKSWTLVVRMADSNTCFLASGTDWVTQAMPPAGTEG